MAYDTSATSRKIVDIEALRAIGILLVVLHHVPDNLLAWVSPRDVGRWFGGGRGVDLFFAVSGFVIGRSLLPQLATTLDRGSDFFRTAIAFWIRRAWRLLPTAWLWIVVPLLLSVVFNESGAFRTFRGNLASGLAALLNFANFQFEHARGLPDPGAGASALFPYWSLSLEEQFYVVLPLLVLLARRRLPLVLALLAGIQLVLDRFAWGIMHVRSDALFLGVLLSLWQGRESYALFQPRFLEHGVARCAFVLVAVAALVLLGSTLETVPRGYRITLVTLVCIVLVWASSYDAGYIVQSRWLAGLLTWIGARSYALYVIHIPAYFFTRELYHRIDPMVPIRERSASEIGLFIATAAALCLVLADLNYRLLEKPLRARGRRIAASFLAGRRPAEVDPQGDTSAAVVPSSRNGLRRS